MKNRRKSKNHISVGRVYIQATFNNTVVTITDDRGNAVAWASAGALGFRGAKKSTPYAAQIAATTATQKAIDMGLNRASIFVNGPGIGRDLAIRAVLNLGITIDSIADTTPIPHNGCRPRKKPRN